MMFEQLCNCTGKPPKQSIFQKNCHIMRNRVIEI